LNNIGPIFGYRFGKSFSQSQLNGRNPMKICLPMYAMIGYLGLGCGATLVPSRPQSAVARHLVNHSTEQSDSRHDLAILAFSEEIIYKPMGNHTNIYTIRSGLQDHAFGHGYALSIKEVTAMGACTKFTVYDFESQTLSWVDGYGYPTCPSPTRTMPKPHVIRITDEGFRDKLSVLALFLENIVKDPRTLAEDKKKISVIHDHLWSTVYPR
jgi:hypothetical protein